MTNIQTFLFFDLETTGLPKEERNHVKITELCFIAASRHDILNTKIGVVPPFQKLSLLFNPEKDVHPVAAKMTGLSRDYLRNCATFANKVGTILAFLKDLEAPVCLVAHNGNNFDFKIFVSEFRNAGRRLPANVLCVDSLQGFRQILQYNPIDYRSLNTSLDGGGINKENINKNSDHEFPNVSIGDKSEKDQGKMNLSVNDISVGETASSSSDSNFSQKPFALPSVYKRLLNKEVKNAHRAEGDCIMLLECAVALKEKFLLWTDANCKKISKISPFVPY